tara:strand:- start:3150 stop:3938 length:789 start_codon:yes stop_codon:yes gene_type:complete
MSRVEAHKFDEGRFQSTFDNYGHGKGNGKSRAAVYKHYNKVKKKPKSDSNKNKATASLSSSTKSNQPAKSEDFVKTDEDDFTKSDHWEDIPWLAEEEGGIAPTIPSPIRRLTSGEGAGLSAAHRATQSQLIRWGFMGVDRGVTHWGRGVMDKPNWNLERHPSDYDALEAATMHAMDANGLSIELNPSLVWGVVVTAAYAPPLTHIARNSDPTVRRSVLRRFGNFLLRPSQWFKGRKKAKLPPSVEAPFHGNPFSDGKGDFVE